jgi:soluble lytic murein transglycosylase-like protein
LGTTIKPVAALVALFAIPLLAALTLAPEGEAAFTMDPVVVQIDEAEIVRRQEIARAVRELGIDWKLAADIHDIARQEGIPPKIAFALVRVESEFDESAISPQGARGLTQLMPSTARYLEPELRDEDLFDRETNLRLGFRYLRMMITRYDDNLRLALLAYNRGPGTVNRHLAEGIDPGNGFASRVFAAAP